MSSAEESHLPAGGFETTRWTLVLKAGDLRKPESHQALATLCQIYWYPLYACVRRMGYERESAEDLTQGFFTQLLEKNYLQAADPHRGRFRTFLLTSLKHFVANEWHRQQAAKRGGGSALFPLELDDAEARFGREAPLPTTPEEIFDRRWALTQLARAMDRLEEEMSDAGRRDRFERLRCFLASERPAPSYKEIATELEMSVGAVKAAVHRMRKRFGDLLRAEVAQTVGSAEEVDAELRYLLSVIGE
ncbi:MAG: RNA polymerase sigma factor [Acidobacteriota bacterium]